MASTFRADRAGEAIRMAVAKLIREEVQDPRLAPVTITACDVSRDLQNAKIFYTVLGDEDERRDARDGFSAATPFLRSRVGEEVPLRTVPEIIYRYDNSTDHAMRIDELLAGLPELQKPEDDKS